jgi:hypothetical protein
MSLASPIWITKGGVNIYLYPPGHPLGTPKDLPLLVNRIPTLSLLHQMEHHPEDAV